MVDFNGRLNAIRNTYGSAGGTQLRCCDGLSWVRVAGKPGEGLRLYRTRND
jgi:hypothetical protein